MGDREKDKEVAKKDPEAEDRDDPEAGAGEDATDESKSEESDEEESDEDESDEDESDEDESKSEESDEEDPPKKEAAPVKKDGESKSSVAPSETAAAPAAAGPSPLVKFFWMPEKLAAARSQGFDKDKPGWNYYELAREAVIAAQRLGELSEAKQGVLLLNREAMVLMARAGLARASVAGDSWSDFAALDAAKPMVEKLTEDERKLVDQVLAADGLDQLAQLPKDRRASAGKALAKVASKLYEELEREANRVASVLYMRWLRILGAVAVVLILVGVVYGAIRRSATGPNLALGAKVTLSSNSKTYGVPPERAVDGDRNELGFHTNNEKNAWVQLDLGSEKRIRKVVVYNRTSNSQRAVPLIVEVSKDRRNWDEVAKRDEDFAIWTAEFSPKKARYVRLKLQDRNFLHLAEIEVY